MDGPPGGEALDDRPALRGGPHPLPGGAEPPGAPGRTGGDPAGGAGRTPGGAADDHRPFHRRADALRRGPGLLRAELPLRPHPGALQHQQRSAPQVLPHLLPQHPGPRLPRPGGEGQEHHQ